MNRRLTDHKVNPVNDRLVIEVLDEPGAGGASHLYRVTGMKLHENPSRSLVPMGSATLDLNILFQQGPIAESGLNGITQEVLLAIVADRLRSFQAGPYSCRENAVALTHVETAMLWLHKRTLDRVARGVEGTGAK